MCPIPAAFAAKSVRPAELRFMSGPPGGNWFALGAALSDVWSRLVLPTSNRAGGGVSNILNTDAKRGEIGLTLASFIGAATAGEEEFAGRKAERTVVMVNLYPQLAYFLLRKDFAEKHGIASLGDLIAGNAPVRFATLAHGTASEFLVRMIFAEGYGVDCESLQSEKGWTAEYVPYETGAELLMHDKLDCFAFSVGTEAALVRRIASETPVLILPVDRQALENLTGAHGVAVHEIKPGVYPFVSAPVETVGDFVCIVIRRDMPDDLVYALNKILWENRRLFSEVVPDMREFTSGSALPRNTPAHPGSVRFWNETKK